MKNMNTRIKKGFKMEVIEHGIITISGPSACGKSTYCKAIAAMFGMPVIHTIGGSTAAGIAMKIKDFGECTILIDECPPKKFAKMQGFMREWIERGCLFVVVIDPIKP